VPTLVLAIAVGVDQIAVPRLRLIVVWKIIAMETEHVFLRIVAVVTPDGKGLTAQRIIAAT